MDSMILTSDYVATRPRKETQTHDSDDGEGNFIFLNFTRKILIIDTIIVTFSALNESSNSPPHKADTTKPTAGYAIHDDDDLDDLFDKQGNKKVA